MGDLDAILEPWRADPRHAAILCDIDGTLAPIVADPALAAVPAETGRLLARLAAAYGLVACISGRRAIAARRLVGLGELTYAGNHGLELLEPGQVEPRIDPALGDRAGAAAGFAAGLDRRALAGAGLRLEDKGPIQAIHWRGAADERAAAERAGRIGALAGEQGLVAHYGRKVLEIRPPAGADKGVAARRLIEQAGATSALFGGDDRTDLDAFRAIRGLAAEGGLEHAVCIAVASAEGPAELAREADLVVEGTGGFADALRRL